MLERGTSQSRVDAGVKSPFTITTVGDSCKSVSSYYFPLDFLTTRCRPSDSTRASAGGKKT